MSIKYEAKKPNFILKIMYLTFLFYPLKSLVNKGLIKNIKISNFVNKIEVGYSLFSFAFLAIFLFIIYTVIKKSEDEIYIIEKSKDKMIKISNKLIPYKILIISTVLFSLWCIYLTKDFGLIKPSILLTATSILIHYSKFVYFKAILFDRKAVWLADVNGGDYKKSSKNTSLWRYKFWFDNKEKVPFKDRFPIIIKVFCSLIFFSLMFFNLVYVIKPGFVSILIGFIILLHILSLIDNIFNLYTSMEGVCTCISFNPGSEDHKSSYTIIVTNYRKKREIKFNSKIHLGIEEGDNVYLVHGFFFKNVISYNYVKLNKNNNLFILFLTLAFFFYQGSDLIKSSIGNVFQAIEVSNQNDDYESRGVFTGHKKKPLSSDESYYSSTFSMSNKASYTFMDISLNKLYSHRKYSKLFFTIKNNSNLPMILNVDHNTNIKGDGGYGSNILLPHKFYELEMDIRKSYDETKDKKLVVNLGYIFSDSILDSYSDYDYYHYYNLDEVSSNCSFGVDFKDNKSFISFDNPDYNVNDEISKFVAN